MANNIETIGDWHWRNAMKPARFFAVDARASAFLFLFLIHMRLWTLGLVGVVLLLFWFLERKGLSFSSAMRSARSWLFGEKRPAWLWIRKRSLVDYGR